MVTGVLSTPLFALIIAVAVLGFLSIEIDLIVLGIEMYRTTDTTLLVAIPLFTFAGFVLAESRASIRMLALADGLLGWLPANLAIVTLITCALFTAFTGASGVTIVALGALLYPALIKGKYGERFSLGLVTSAGSMGLLLPPSLPLILYGIIIQQMDQGRGVFIEDLFIAGIGPTLLMMLMVGGYMIWYQSKHKLSSKRDKNPVSAKRALWHARWELPLPIVVLGGIYGGFLAVSEIAAITALYVLVVEVFIYKEISFKHLYRLTVDAMTMVGSVLIILAASLALTNYLVFASVPTLLLELVSQNISHPLVFLLLLNIFLLFVGILLDIFAALVIVVPLILPLAVGHYGIDPIHLGIIFLANMQIGYLTPPVGMNLFIASSRFKTPMLEVCRASLPFISILMVALLIITYVPALSLAPIGR